MKIHQLLIAAATTLIAGLSCAAQSNLISNGTFETWSGGIPTSWSTNNSANLYQNTGLGSGTSAVVQNATDLRQLTSAAAKDFSVSFNFTINKSDTGAFSQSLVIALYQTTDLINSGGAWIHLRLQSFNTSTQSYSLAINDGTAWQTVTSTVFTPSVLDSGNATYSSVNQYQLTLTFNDASNTYSIGYGTVGGSVTTLSNLSYFRNATTHDGLKGLQFYANQNGYGLDNVVVTAIPEPSTYALAASACALMGVMIRRRRRA